MNPLTEFGSVESSTTTLTHIESTTATQITRITNASGTFSLSKTQTAMATFTTVESHAVPDWVLPLTIIAVLAIALVVIAVATRKKT